MSFDAQPQNRALTNSVARSGHEHESCSRWPWKIGEAWKPELIVWRIAVPSRRMPRLISLMGPQHARYCRAWPIPSSSPPRSSAQPRSTMKPKGAQSRYWSSWLCSRVVICLGVRVASFNR